MYQNTAEFLSELPLHLALFACGAIGWSATRWASRRFGTPRKMVVSLPSRACSADCQEFDDNASVDTCSTQSPCASSPGSSPTALMPTKHLSSGARRRANRRAEAAAAAAAAFVEKAADVTEEAMLAEKEEEPEFDGKVNFEDSAASSTTFETSSQNEEPEPEALRTSSLDQLVSNDESADIDDGSEGQPMADMAVEEPLPMSDPVAKVLEKKAHEQQQEEEGTVAASLHDERQPESELSKKEQEAAEEETEEQLASEASPPAAITNDDADDVEPPAEESEVGISTPAAPLPDVAALASSGKDEDEQPVEPIVSERITKMMAKKAERKAKKAEERRWLEEQLAAATAKTDEGEELEEEEVGAEEAEAEQEVEAPRDGTARRELWVDMEEDAPLPSDEEDEPDEEPPFRGAATWSGPDDSIPEWRRRDPEERPSEIDWSSFRSRSSGRPRAWTEPAPPIQEEWSEEEWSPEDEWMVPLDEMTEAPESTVQAQPPSVPPYQPIMTEDGQQLYTDGQQVYMVAALTVEQVTTPKPSTFTPVVDPCDPLHQAFIASTMSAPAHADHRDMSGSWPTSS